MKNAVLLPGKPTRERYENPLEPKPHEANWFPWLGRQLEARGVSVAIPAFPKPYFPVYADWQPVFEQNPVGEETVLAGHSAGAEFLLRWLSENRDVAVERAVLVAPYHDFARKYGDFSEYDLDADLAVRVGKLTVFNSLDDDPAIQENVQRLTGCLPGIHVVTFTGYGHFRTGYNMPGEEFPELLRELTGE